MWWFGLLLSVSDAAACGAFGLTDVERGVKVHFGATRVKVTPPGDHLMSIWSDLSPELAAWNRENNLEQPLPAGARWAWKVGDVGQPNATDGTLIVREGVPIGEWVGLHRLRLGQETYAFALQPMADPHDGERWFKLAVDRDGERIIEGAATSLCLRPLPASDQQREIRTRVAFYLAETRSPEPIVPEIARIDAIPAPIPAELALRPATITANSTLDTPYRAQMLSDGDRTTAWCEGAAGLGVGKEITIALQAPTDPVLVWVQGYAKDARRLTGNAQPRRLLARTDTGVVVEAAVPYVDDPTAPSFSLPLDAPGTKRIVLTLIEAWHGRSWEDTCLSELGVASR